MYSNSNTIENETNPLRLSTNIFILLIRKCEKPTPRAGYRYSYATNKEM